MNILKFDNSDIDYWFTSDTHINHQNIIKGISNWSDTSRCRPFKGRDDHNWEIINNINKYVKPDDVLFHLGDWSFGGISSIWWFRKHINCRNIYLCIGNHDHHIRANKELPNTVKEYYETNVGEYDYEFVDTDKIGYQTHTEHVLAQELFTDVQLMYDIEVHGHKMTLSHYCMETWFYHNKGSFMLYGHSHDSLRPDGKRLDVGIDTAKRLLGEYRPFKFQEIQKIMSSKEVSMPDHHNSTTNA